MQISHQGLLNIKEAEGFRASAYKDTGGVWTIGYGTTRVNARPVEQGMTCTQEQAEQWLYADIASAQSCVNQSVRIQMNQGQYDALVDFVYNLGESAFRKSTLLTKLNMHDYIGAAKEFDRWIYDNGKIQPGLVTRRRIERDEFEGPSSNS